MKAWLSVVGVGEDGLEGLAPAARALLDGAERVVGGARHLAMLPDDDARPRAPWPTPLAGLLPLLESWRGEPTCVLASGDPLCFGVGTTLLRRFESAEVRVVPQASAFALARARLGWSAHETSEASVHGRPTALLRAELHPRARLLLLAGRGGAPGEVARALVEAGYGASPMHALERLGGPRERLLHGRADAWAEAPPEADPLHVVAVECRAGPEARLVSRAPGLDDSLFEHDGQMTRREARALALSALEPHPGALLWDLGAGAGSVSIEWMRAARGARAVAVERHPERARAAAANALALGTPGLEVETREAEGFLSERAGADGRLRGAAEGAAAPDAVFLGGGLSEAVVEGALRLLGPGGRLVAHAVTLESEALLFEMQARHGGDLARFAVQRAEALGPKRGWRAAMPVVQWRLRTPRTDGGGR